MRYPITTYSTNSFHMKRCENVFAYKNDIVTVLCVSHKTRRITPTNISFHIKRAGLNHFEWPHFECFRKNEKKKTYTQNSETATGLNFSQQLFILKLTRAVDFVFKNMDNIDHFECISMKNFDVFFPLSIPFTIAQETAICNVGYEDILKNHYAMTHACINKIFHLYFVDAISPTCHMVCTFFVNNLNTMNRLLS